MLRRSSPLPILATIPRAGLPAGQAGTLTRGLAIACGAVLLACVAGPTGCGRPAKLDVYVPCLLSSPFQRVVARFQESHPGTEIAVLVDKPLAQIATVQSLDEAAGVAITLGDIEMNSLVAARVVRPEDVTPFAVNTYPVVAVAPAAATANRPRSLTALASPAMKRIFIEDPARSSLGDRATRGLKDAGLWPAVSAKVVRPEPNAMILAELLGGKADAAVVFEGCLFAEKGVGGALPKTIRVIGRLPPDSYPPIVYQAAPLARNRDAGLARAFTDFLRSSDGQAALRGAGLTPPDQRGR